MHSLKMGLCARNRIALRFRWPLIGLARTGVLLALALPAATHAQANPCTMLEGNFCMQAVGSLSGEQTVTVKAQAAGTVSAVRVLTLGVSGLDFEPGAGAMTCPSATLSFGAICTESVTFSPAYPGERMGAVELLDAGNNVLGVAYLSGIGVGALGVLITGNILPVAGDGAFEGPVLDGNPATDASLNHPSSVVLDGAGDLYIADRYHNRIRKVDESTGLISTLAGNGLADYAGDGSVSTSSNVSLNTPWGVAVDGAGNVYVADTGNNAVREIVAATGIISTLAGTGVAGASGDNGPATDATLNQPQGVSIDNSGNVYIADTANQRIRMVDPSTGIITTLAGDGIQGYAGDLGESTSAELNFPFAVAFDPAGNMYIPDSGNNVVRRVDSYGIITTVAGIGSAGDTGDGAAATQATLFSPSGVAADAAGNLYIADTQNASIRKVSASTGFISTIAKNEVGVYVFNGGGPYAVSIYGPIGLALDGNGDLYFADSLNMRIREIQGNFSILDYLAGAVRQGSQSTAQVQTIENDGNAPLDVTSIVASANALLDPPRTTCAVNAPLLAPGADCDLGIFFAPTVSGSPLIGNVEVAGNTPNSPLDIELIGDATVVSSTTIAMASNPNPSGFGTPVALSATVATGAGTGNLTGTVTFLDGAATLATNVHVGPTTVNGSDASATARFSIATLTVGSHSISASYVNTADPTHFPSTSAPLIQLVVEGTSTALVSNMNPSTVGHAVAFTATVAAAGGGGSIPDGIVTFADGSAILCSAPLDAGAVAMCTTASLTNGPHSIVATYTGDSANQISGSISATLTQAVLEPSIALVASQPNPSSYGSPVTFTVKVTSSGAFVPTGAVKIFADAQQIGATTLSASTGIFSTAALGVGTHTITAAYTGDAYNGPATSPAIIQVVIAAMTSTTLNASPSPAIADSPLALAATVKAEAGVVPSSAMVRFTDTFNGSAALLGSVSLADSGTVVLHPRLVAGLHILVAAYTGDLDDGGSVSLPLALTVNPATTSIALRSTPNPSVVRSPITFTANVTGDGGIPAGIVAFLDNGVAIGSMPVSAQGAATLNSSKLAPGTHVITAAYDGDANNQPSKSFALNQVVGTIPTTTDLGVSTTPGPNAEVILVATVAGTTSLAPAGSVTFTVGTSTIGSATLNASGVATLTPNLAVGTYRVVANYGGDALHSSSASPAMSVSGVATSFSVGVAPASITLAAKQNATVSVTLTSVDSFSDTIGLGCATLPAGVTCHFSAPSVSLPANSTKSVQLTIDTDDPLTGGSSAMTTHSHQQGASLAGLLFPFGMFFGSLLCRDFGRRRCERQPILLVLACCLLPMASCTTFSQASAAPGTYMIQVNGTGVNSNLSHYQNVTLVITK